MDNVSKKILVVDDDYSIRTVLKEALQEEGYIVQLAGDGESAFNLASREDFDLVITDLVMPKYNGIELMEQLRKINPTVGFLIITAFGSIEKAVEAMQKGAYDFITKPFTITHIRSRLKRFFEFQGLQEENLTLRQKLSQSQQLTRLIGQSAPMQTIFNQINVVAQSDAPVFIQGESGTGKELIAQAIHEASKRHNQRFIKVNCAAIPETLFESTLFGHEKGAFTSAIKTTKGLFEEANGGTFLLDEISEMPINMQAKLLRVLQEGKLTRVGSAREIDVDVRIIATTNRNILKMVEENSFRSDLYFRLNVFPIKVPPLRSRIEDIPLLLEHFLHKFQKKYGYEKKVVDQQTVAALMREEWPGNVRQLENLIERAILYSGNSETLTLEHFSLEHELIATRDSLFDDRIITIAEMEKKMILAALEKTQNNRTKAAELLGISVRTLRNKLHEYEDGETTFFNK
jgi:DNA-binding NtrC family response regulator